MHGPRAGWLTLVATSAIGLVIPTLSLVLLGSLWLWERGYTLHWALGAAGTVGIAFLIQRRLLEPRAAAQRDPEAAQAPSTAGLPPDQGWTPAEMQAWADVERIAADVDVQRLSSRDAVLALGAETVQAVARRLHPEVAHPVWQFTVPEAFAILERVSRRLGSFAVENIPFSDRMTVAQALALYRWRGVIDIAEKAYDVWRLVRLANPLAAASLEVRERLTRQVLAWSQAHVAQRLARAYVAEVGRAAIDLYGGRLDVTRIDGLSPDAEADLTAMATRSGEPLRVLIAGQAGAGRSSLLNAMAGTVEAPVDVLPAGRDLAPAAIDKEGLPRTHLIEGPDLGSSPEAREKLVAQALNCDLVLWVVPAHRADRDPDRRAVVALRDAYDDRPDRVAPPILVVLTHVDRLRPLGEWRPPYDLARDERPKAVAIKAAIAAVAEDLALPPADVVPVSLAPAAHYNMEVLWERLMTALPAARRAQLVRQARTANRSWQWRRTWDQARGAGKIIAGAIRK